MNTSAATPEPSLHDLATELSALRERVAKLESVVTFRVNPDTGKEKVIVCCGTLMCDRLRIDGGKGSRKDGPHVVSGIRMECDRGMPSIVLDHYGEDRCQRSVTLGFDDNEMPELSVDYAMKGGVRIGLNEHLAGDIVVQDAKMRDTINLRATPHGGGLLIRGEEGDARLVLEYARVEKEDGSVSQDGASVRLYRKDAKPAASLSMTQGGDSRLDLNRVDGALHATMHTTKEAAVVLLQSPATKAGVVLAATGDHALVELNQNVTQPGHGKVGLISRTGEMSATFDPGTGKPRVDLFASKNGASATCRNGAGKDLATLGIFPGDVAGMNLSHPNGDKAMCLVVVKDTPTLSMIPANAKEASVVLAAHEKISSMVINRAGQPLVQIQGTEEGGTISVNATPDANHMRATMAARSAGASVQISTMDGTQLASMHGQTYGGAMTLSSELGFPRVMALALEDMGVLQLDCSGTRGLKAAATPLGGGVVVYDPKGKSIAALPEGMMEEPDDKNEVDD